MSHTSDSDSIFSRPYSNNSQLINVHTWQDFHQFISRHLQETGVVIPAYDQVPETPNIYDCFKEAVAKSKDHVESGGKVLTNACLYQLTSLGHIVLEDTNDKNDKDFDFSTAREIATISHYCKSDLIASKFCKACAGGETVHECTNIRQHSIDRDDRRAPGISAALPTSPYPESSPVLSQLRSSLNPNRCWPVNIVAVIEIKSRTEAISSRSNVRQSAQYLETLLRSTPRRDVAFGVVTNLNECIFLAVTVEIGANRRRIYEYHHSAVIPLEHLVHELTSFSATPAAALGQTFHFPVHIFTPMEFLGRGSTSTAILGHWQGQELVMKLSVHLAPMEVERRVARYTTRLDIAGIPRIHEACQKEMEELFLGHCNVFTERFDHIHQKSITVAHLKQIWSVLCDLHDAGLVHRDIRSPNICLRHGRAVLIDLSNCMFYNPVLSPIVDCFEGATKTTMNGTAALYDTTIVTTASDAVQRGQPTLPADEGCALLYCAMQVYFETPVVRNMRLEREDFIKMRSRWANYITAKPIPPQVATIKACLAHLGSMRETSTRVGRTDVVHKGLHAIYELSVLVRV